LAYIDRPNPEYEPVLILKIFRNPHDFLTNMAFFPRFRGTLSEKLYFS
jgi:hypothetical protein